MQKYANSVQDTKGDARTGASVTVYTDAAHTTLATIYSDDGITQTSNPLTTNSLGEFYFYAADGRYYLKVTKSGVTTQFLDDVLLFDPNASTGAAFVKFTPSGTGATSRNVQARMRDWVTVFDFMTTTQIGDVQSNTAAVDVSTAIQAAFNSGAKCIYFPRGTYLVTARLKQFTTGGWKIYGDGPNVTAIRLGGNLASSLLDIAGTDKDSHVSDFVIEDILFHNPSRTYTGDIVTAASASALHWRNVLFQGINGRAYDFTEVWDSVLVDVHVDDSGSESATKESVRLTCADTADGDTGCNNITWIGGRIEGSHYVGMLWGKHTRKCVFNSKIHGDLPTPAPYDGLQLKGAYGNIILGNITANGAAGISLDVSGAQGSDGNVIDGIIDANSTWGVDIVSGGRNAIRGQFGANGVNTSGSARVQAGSNNAFDGQSADTVVLSGTWVRNRYGRETMTVVDATSTGYVRQLVKTGAAFDSITDQYAVSDAAGTVVTGVEIVASTQNATAAAVDVDLRFNARGNGTLAEVGRFKGDGKHLQIEGELRAKGDSSGAAGYNALTGTSDVTANSTGVGSIKFKGATSRDSSGFIKIYVGTTAYYVPIFSAISG